jgi:hypothetical protein
MKADRQGLWATGEDLRGLCHGEAVPSDQHQDLSVLIGQGIEGAGEIRSITKIVGGLMPRASLVQPGVEVRQSSISTLPCGNHLSRNTKQPWEWFGRQGLESPPRDEERLCDHVLRVMSGNTAKGEGQN